MFCLNEFIDDHQNVFYITVYLFITESQDLPISFLEIFFPIRVIFFLFFMNTTVDLDN